MPAQQFENTTSKNARKSRGPNPRGPRPQVCDRCYIRKIKCDRLSTGCTTCIKVGANCSYNRNGFLEPVIFFPKIPASFKTNLTSFINSTASDLQPTSGFLGISIVNNAKPNKFHIAKSEKNLIRKPIRISDRLLDDVLRSSLFSNLQSRALLTKNGSCLYMGKSMATFYYSSNSHLFSDSYLIGGKNETTGFAPLKLPPENPIEDVSIPKFSLLVQHLVELYFSYLNSFFPVIHPPTFFRLLNKNSTQPDFLALLNAVCLSGTSYYPNREIARSVAIQFSEKFMLHIKKIYNRPSLLAIQACTVASYHINLCETDRVIHSAWFLLGLAQRMCTQLGLHIECPLLSKSLRQARLRSWWVIGCADTVLGHCFGRPIQVNATRYSPLPQTEKFFTATINFASSEIILAKDILAFSTEQNAFFFRSFCKEMQLMHRLSRVKSLLSASALNDSDTNSFSLTSILNPDPNDNSSEKMHTILNDFTWSEKRTREEYRVIEADSCKIYHDLILGSEVEALHIPTDIDLHKAYLLLIDLSLLIDVNKPFINRPTSTSSNSNIERNIAIALDKPLYITTLEYCNSIPLVKFIWVSRLVVKLVQIFGDDLLIPSSPILWYVLLQVNFALLVVLDRLPTDSNAALVALSLAKELDLRLSQHANRWAIIRDMYAISSPLVHKSMARFSQFSD